MRTWLNRLAGLINKRQHEAEFKKELETNLQLQIEDNIRAGMNADEARRAARLRFGSIDAASEAVRDRRGIPFVETCGRDIIYALRTLRQNTGWSAVAILSLALGVGANSALFALINNYALEKLPVRNPDELVVFRWYGANTAKSLISDYANIDKQPDEPAGSAFSFFTSDRFRGANQTLSDIVAFAPAGQLSVFTDAQAEFATGYFVSGNFFSALGIFPATGRALTPADDSETANPVVVISHPYWQLKFQSDARILGKTITINSAIFTVVGIAPADLVDITKRGSVNAPDIIIPLGLEPRIRGKEGSWLRHPQNWWLTIIGRLRPGVTAEQVQANHADVFEQAARDGWNAFVASMPPQSQANPNLGARAVRVPKLRVVSANRGISDANGEVFNQLAILGAISATVLLIVCVNLANLFLSRAAGRKKEIAVRMAIGASRGRVVRQLLTESLVVSALGGALGLLFAVWCTRLLSSVVFRIDSFSTYSYRIPKIDLTVLLFSGLLTLLTGLAFGIIPAMRTTQLASAPALREGENKFSPSRSLLGRSLLIVQIASSLVLLIGAALFMRTLWNLSHLDVGFNPDNLVVFTLQPGLSGYSGQSAVALYEQIEQSILRVPGVRSLTFAAPEGLLAFGETQFDLWTTGAGGEPVNSVASLMATAPNFFDTMEVPLKQGRKFTSADTQASPLVAIVSERLARTLSPDGNAIGKFLGNPQAPASRRVEVIGIAADAKVNSLRDSASPLVYRPITQLPFPWRTIVVRTAVEERALLRPIAEAIRQVDPRLPIGQLSTEMDRIEGSYLMNERVFASASAFFGGLAVIIAMIGLFGLMSYSVVRRTKEIGIRIALGAERQAVLRSVLTETLLLVGIGIVFGLGGALAATRVIATLLFGIAPHDPLTISVAVALMVTVSVFAGYLPARRASRVDPTVALRHE